MEKVIERATQLATIGGMVGSAIGAILTNVEEAAPNALVKCCLRVVVNEVSIGAVGTLAGAGIGAIVGGIEEMMDEVKEMV